MTRRVVFGLFVALVLVAGAVLVGGFAYRMGLMQGLAQNPVIVAPEGNGVAPYYWHGGPGMWRGGWGGGFGFLGCLIPLFFIFLLFGLLRMAFWRGPWGMRRGWGGPGWGGPGFRGWDREKVPPMVEEWHRKLHESQASGKPDAGQPTQGE